MAVTAQMVKALREQTGAGMMDCKTALSETGADIDAAVDWLRKKGLAKAAKKAGRVAAEGLIGVAGAGHVAAVVEINSETDFVARNETFQTLVSEIATLAVEKGDDREALGAAQLASAGKSVDAHITDMVGSIGENLTLRRAARLSAEPGVVAHYVHNQVAPGLGKIGVLVAVKSDGPADAIEAFGRQVAMHVAATNPMALGPNDLDPAMIERERAVIMSSEDVQSKPENVREKMVDGRIRKFQQEVCLLQQVFVMAADGKATVADAAKQKSAELGTSVEITGFARFQLGEGIEKEESDFASEVAAAAGAG